MRSKEELDKIITEISAEKETLRGSFSDNPDKVLAFYNSLKGLSIDHLKKIFYAPRSIVEQNIFNVTSGIIAGTTIAEKAFAVISLARPDNIKNIDPELFRQDMRLLQGVFFFLLRDICETGTFFASEERKLKIKEFFNSALEEKSWHLPGKQSEILNKISKDLGFLKEVPFTDIDFTKFEGNYFKANEGILRILANFMPPENEAVPREKLINVINFVREHQESVLKIFPNRKTSNYSQAEAHEEITKVLMNLEKLKELDFGFKDQCFTQTFFAGNEKFRREITCKFFEESEMEWLNKSPSFKLGKPIQATKDDRFTNRSALNHKFLYPERNRITHLGVNVAVYKLFDKYSDQYTDSLKREQILNWKMLVFLAFFDSYQYLCELKKNPAQKENAEKLITILNHYFKKITAPLNINAANNEELWHKVFNFEKETENLTSDELDKINIYNNDVLDEDELTHLKKFMSFLYCSENEEVDFFEKHAFAIQIYLIYLTLELAKMDKCEEKHQ